MSVANIQLVWDRGCAGTAQAESGCSIHVGPGGEWTPEQLLIAAVESSLMSDFLRLADESGLVVMGYVSAASATFDTDTPGPPRVVVRPCVVVEHEEDEEKVRRLLASAVERSPVLRVLGDAVAIDAEVVALGSVEAS